MHDLLPMARHLSLGLLLLHFGMAVLGLMMSIAALAVPVLLVLALLRWLFGAGQ